MTVLLSPFVCSSRRRAACLFAYAWSQSRLRKHHLDTTPSTSKFRKRTTTSRVKTLPLEALTGLCQLLQLPGLKQGAPQRTPPGLHLPSVAMYRTPQLVEISCLGGGDGGVGQWGRQGRIRRGRFWRCARGRRPGAAKWNLQCRCGLAQQARQSRSGKLGWPGGTRSGEEVRQSLLLELRP